MREAMTEAEMMQMIAQRVNIKPLDIAPSERLMRGWTARMMLLPVAALHASVRGETSAERYHGAHYENVLHLRDFEVLRDEKSAEYYRYHHDKVLRHRPAFIHITLVLDTMEVLSNSSLLYYELMLERGLSAEELAAKGDVYEAYLGAQALFNQRFFPLHSSGEQSHMEE